WYVGFRGVTQGAIGGARIQLKKDAKSEQKPEEAPKSWDGHPLPRILPDLGLDEDDRDRPRSKPAGQSNESTLRAAPVSWRGPWGEGLTAQILLLTPGLSDSGYAMTFTGEESVDDQEGDSAKPGRPLRGAHDRRFRFSARGTAHQKAWRTPLR